LKKAQKMRQEKVPSKSSPVARNTWERGEGKKEGYLKVSKRGALVRNQDKEDGSQQRLGLKKKKEETRKKKKRTRTEPRFWKPEGRTITTTAKNGVGGE